MPRLEEKLKELGYRPLNNELYDGHYLKENIYIVIHNNKIIKDICYVAIKQQSIQNRNDIQALKDSIEYYDEQLKIMQKDLEVLKNVED